MKLFIKLHLKRGYIFLLEKDNINPQINFIVKSNNNNNKEDKVLKKSYIILVALFFIFIICNSAKSFRHNQENEKKEEKAIINKDEFKTITAEQLLEKIKEGGKLFVIDCRPEDEYNAGHLPGAMNFAVYFCIFDKDTVIKVAMEKMIEEKGKKIDLILKDRANGNVYMPKSKMMELLKYLPEDCDQEVIFYCRWPT